MTGLACKKGNMLYRRFLFALSENGRIRSLNLHFEISEDLTHMLYLLIATYGTVLFAEMLSDKSIYTISTLATRFRLLHVFVGTTLAFMGKMLIAVLLGRTIAELPKTLVASISAITFFTSAIVLWLKKFEEEQQECERQLCWFHAVLVSFAAIFFTEWGDIGQITVAALTARYQAPLIILLGATAALVTKGLLASILGAKLREIIPKNSLRYSATVICVVMGILSMLRMDLE